MVWHTQQPSSPRAWTSYALARAPGTSTTVWSPELLLASANHCPAAVGHAGVRVQAAVRLRYRGCGLPCSLLPIKLPWPSRTPWPSGDRGAEGPAFPGEGLLEEEDRSEHNFEILLGQERRLAPGPQAGRKTGRSHGLHRAHSWRNGTARNSSPGPARPEPTPRAQPSSSINCAAIPRGLGERTVRP